MKRTRVPFRYTLSIWLFRMAARVHPATVVRRVEVWHAIRGCYFGFTIDKNPEGGIPYAERYRASNPQVR